jgi:hypothetical protein
MSVFSGIKSMTEFTCTELDGPAINGEATKNWGNIAITTLADNVQHWWPVSDALAVLRYELAS